MSLTMNASDIELSDEFAITKKFRNANEFSLFIEESIVGTGLTYMEYLIDYCETNNIDCASIKTLISPALKEKIRLEAECNGMMRKLGTPALQF